MPAKTKTPSKIKCPWCGRVIGFSKSGNIEPHVGPGGVKCVGVGQPRDQVLAQMQLHEECLAEKRRRSR